MTNTQKVRNNRSAFKIGLLALLFFGPFILSWFLYMNRDLLSFGTLNKGQLIQPPLQFANLPVTDTENKKVDSKALAGKWWILYVNALPCDEQCQTTIHTIRQVWLVLGKDRDRIKRALITFPVKKDNAVDTILAKDYPGMVHYGVKQADLKQFLRGIVNANSLSSMIFVMDPMGRIMLRYPAAVPPKDLKSDLQRLLNVSQIG